MNKEKENFWIEVNIHEGDKSDTDTDLKEMLVMLRTSFLKDTQAVLAEKVGLKPASIKNYEERKEAPYIGIALLKRLCLAYGLKCKLKIYK